MVKAWTTDAAMAFAAKRVVKVAKFGLHALQHRRVGWHGEQLLLALLRWRRHAGGRRHGHSVGIAPRV